MAVVMHHKGRPTPGADWPLLAGLFFTAIFIVSLLPMVPAPVKWLGLACLPLGIALAVRRQNRLKHRRAAAAIRERLTRLPDDFVVLNDLSVPAPWGQVRLDHVVISRFGVVVADNSPGAGWMPERVEAVRSFLFARGLMQPGFPIRPLVLLPPGAPSAHLPACSAPAVSVERLSLTDLAPSRVAIFTPDQIRSMAHCLLQVQRAS